MKNDQQFMLPMSSLELKISELLYQQLDSLGYNLVRVKFFAKSGKLQIMLARNDLEPVSIADCEQASYSISPILDVADLISGRYDLEVSSPGINRPLVKLADFKQFIGTNVRISLNQLVAERKRFQGQILAVTDEYVELKDGTAEIHQLPFAVMDSAQLYIN